MKLLLKKIIFFRIKTTKEQDTFFVFYLENIIKNEQEEHEIEALKEEEAKEKFLKKILEKYK